MTTSTTPWQIKPVRPLTRIGLLILSTLLLITAVVAIFLVIATAGEVSHSMQVPGDLVIALARFLGTVGLAIGSFYGVIAIYRRVNPQSLFTPTTTVPAPTLGSPFEVRFRRPSFGQTVDGPGTITFQPEQLLIAGTLAPSGWLQIAVIVVVTVLPLIFFGVGFGIIPAFLLASWIGRRKYECAIPYSAIRDLEIKQCLLTFTIADPKPRKLRLFAAAQDGERLYRELYRQFPTKLNGWQP